MEAVGSKAGDDSITWLHRRCAGLSKEAFNDLVSQTVTDPFYCPMCRLDKQELKLKSLRDLVASLSSHLSLVADELAALKSEQQATPTGSSSHHTTYASVLTHEASVGARDEATRPSASPALAPAYDSNNRKYNLLIFGLNESDKETPRFRRGKKRLLRRLQCSVNSRLKRFATSSPGLL